VFTLAEHVAVYQPSSGRSGASGSFRSLEGLTRYNFGVSPRTDDLREALRADVATLYKYGLDPAVGSATIPRVAALADALSQQAGESSDGYQVVKDFLHRVIGEVSERVAKLPKRKHVTPQQAADGLLEVFGIGKSGYHEGKLDRGERGGQAWGYAPEVFRRAERDNVKILETLIPEELVNQLVTLAEDHGFTYSGPLPPSPDGKTELERIEGKAQLVNGEWALKASTLGRAIFEEVQTLCHKGFQTAAREKRSIKNLAALAERAAQGRNDRSAFAQDLEAVLLWVVDQIAESDHRDGVIEFLGLGEKRGLSLKERREHAALSFGYEDGKRFVNDGRESRIIHFIRDRFVILAGEMDDWPVEPDSAVL
jgi:hypothetical protein